MEVSIKGGGMREISEVIISDLSLINESGTTSLRLNPEFSFTQVDNGAGSILMEITLNSINIQYVKQIHNYSKFSYNITSPNNTMFMAHNSEELMDLVIRIFLNQSNLMIHYINTHLYRNVLESLEIITIERAKETIIKAWNNPQ